MDACAVRRDVCRFKDRQRETRMAHKHDAGGRHHISKARRVVTNWREYEARLRRRGSLTLWITSEAIGTPTCR